MSNEISSQQLKSDSFCLSRSSKDDALSALNARSDATFSTLDLSLLSSDVDEELIEQVLAACSRSQDGVELRLAHNELGSGTDCEQRLFDVKAEKAIREGELKMQKQKKFDASKAKDFTESAQKRKSAEEAIDKISIRLEAVDAELVELEERKLDFAWYKLFTRLESQNRNGIKSLDLSNCGLHSTGLSLLTNIMLELEQRGDDVKICEIILDGNDLGDIGMAPLASLMRLTSHLEVLRLRNVGASEDGVSQILSGLVSNKTLALVDLRNNGLCNAEVVKAAVEGVRRFNKKVEICID